MKTPDETARPSSPAADPGWVRRVIRGLKSIRFAIVLMALIAAASIVGTLIAQEPVEPGPAIARYGRVVGSLVVLLGLNHLYVTWWFLGLLGLLALSIAACTFSGVRFTLRKTFTLITHASILLIVAGAKLLAEAREDLKFVVAANPVHNPEYASSILENVCSKAAQVAQAHAPK